MILLTVICQIAVAAAPLQEPNFNFKNTRSIHLRDENLQNPQVIQKNAHISIDPEFLKEHLGQENPGIEKIQQLLLNPTEASKNIVTETTTHANKKGAFSDYFFPVTIKTPNGETKKGKMALQAYHRNGQMEIKMTDGSDMNWKSNEEYNRQNEILKELNSSVTEAEHSAPCQNCKTDTLKFQVEQISGAIDHSANKIPGTLFQKYQQFSRDFIKANGPITRRNAGHKKRLYIRTLIDNFGTDEASLILAALTGYGEAPTRNKPTDQIAEIAAVLKVIDNRARVNFRKRSSTLRDIHVTEDLNPRLTNILANSQFSVWNDFDNNLVRILNYNPDKADPASKRRMTLAFEAQQMMSHNEIEFIGKMNYNNLYHYHANYTTPNWAQTQKRIDSPTIRIRQTSPNGHQHSIDVVLPSPSKQGTRHIFYAGIP